MKPSIPPWALTLPWNVITPRAALLGISSKLVGSIVMAESGGVITATRYEAGYPRLCQPEAFARDRRVTLETEKLHQKTAWGCMGVMGAVARENGFKGDLVRLANASLSLEFGALHLKHLLNRHRSIRDAVAAYKSDSSVKTSDYVEAVMALYAEVGGVEG